MLERKITKVLEEWKKEKNKPCLLIKGARQVGKSYIIEKFINDNYKNSAIINFELTPELKNIFDGNLDFETLTQKLSLVFPNIINFNDKPIIFFDEIQNCPNARVTLKTFALDGRIDVIASSSLLGLYYKEVTSYPVGYERTIKLYPLDFEEFLWTNNINKTIISNLKHNFIKKEKIDTFILDKINELFKKYLLIGGMPKIVEDYTLNKNLVKVISMQKDLIENYKTITRYMKFEQDTNIYVDNENVEHYPLSMLMFI